MIKRQSSDSKPADTILSWRAKTAEKESYRQANIEGPVGPPYYERQLPNILSKRSVSATRDPGVSEVIELTRTRAVDDISPKKVTLIK